MGREQILISGIEHKVKKLFEDPELIGVMPRCYIRASFVRDSIFNILGHGNLIIKYKGENVPEFIELPFSIYYSAGK